MGYALLWFCVAATYLMPSAFVPALEEAPIFEFLILTCLLCSSMRVLDLLARDQLVRSPMTALLLALMGTVALSHLAQVNLTYTYDATMGFAKLVVFYFVLVSNLDTPSHLRRFLPWVAILIAVLLACSLTHYHGWAYLSEQLDPIEREQDFGTADSGEPAVFLQLRGVGFFQDPNDICQAIVVAIFLISYELGCPGSILLRAFWLVPLGLCLAAFPLTHSRGGFIALVLGSVTFVIMRFGWRRSLPASLIVIPGLLFAFGGRQTAISASAGTAQTRIQLWAGGLALFRERPLTGIGSGLHADALGHDAHNSFVHAFVELGFLGGMCFLGLFAHALGSLVRLGSRRTRIDDNELARFRPYLGAIVGGYVGGMLSLSRVYVMPTYLVLALVSSYLRVAGSEPPPSPLTPRLVLRLAGIALVFLIGVHLYVRAFAHWGGG